MPASSVVLVACTGWLGLWADGPAAADQTASQHQAFVGEWALNASLSDDPRAKMREERPDGGGRRGPGGGGWGGGGRGGGGWGGGRGGGGWGGGGRGGGGWGGGGGRPPGEGASRSGEGRVRPMALTADRLTIANLEPEITMLEPDGTIRRLHADGKGYRDSNDAELKTRWEGSDLVVETSAGRGKSKETWSVSGEPARLTLLLQIDRPFGGTVKIKRVFDRALPGSQAAPPSTQPTAPAAP